MQLAPTDSRFIARSCVPINGNAYRNMRRHLLVIACYIRNRSMGLNFLKYAIYAVLAPVYFAWSVSFAVSGPDDPPVYNPMTKSYFQLLTLDKPAKTWRIAKESAESLTYKGARGRLAVVDRLETHRFILENFDFRGPSWIGLRYWCRFRMLEWSGQRPYSPTDPDRFHVWHPQWYRNEATKCSSNSRSQDNYMPVYYQPIGEHNAIWQASGHPKYFNFYLVEFPTGEE